MWGAGILDKYRIRVSWSKVANACCYKIQYSTNANFKKASTKTVSASKTSIVIKNLKKNKKYYVRVHAVKHNGCVTILGKNSAKKSVKVK